MDNNISDVPLGARVLWNETAPELYAYQVLGDDLFPRVRAGEFLVVDPRKACEFGRDVLITSTDGRHAVLQFIGKRGGMVSFQVVGTISKPVTLAERDIATMHLIRSISGPDDLILPP